MSRSCSPTRFVRPAMRVACLAILSSVLLPQARGQFVSQQVGGVSIDARGVVTKIRVDQQGELLRQRKAAFQAVPGDLAKKSPLRKVSLRQLEAAIADFRDHGKPLSDDMRYLAGLQRIQYVFVYPDQNDIVLVGPGEGWRIGPDGEIVGETTGQPVMLLDDLLVALRATDALRQTGITCSIDPAPAGLERFQSLMNTLTRAPNDPRPLMNAVEKAMGQQTITVQGVPETSHFARVLVAADYRMKRLGMALDTPPIQGLPSYLHMLRNSRGGGGLAPRWWLAPDYDALVTAGDGLAWEFRKAGVKAVTEESILTASGQLRDTTRKSPLAQKWADNMTAHYDELAAEQPIWGQLRNCMDLAVLSALISHHDLAGKCGWDMSLLLSPDLKAKRFNPPRSVATLASYVERRSGLIISASGGVAINPWPTLESPEESPALDDTRKQAAASSTSWWWD